MNEEDTFNALIRTPIERMIKLYIKSNHRNEIERLALFERHGWPWDDFCKELKHVKLLSI